MDRFRDHSFRVVMPSVGGDDNWHVTDDGDTCVAHCFGFARNLEEGEQLAHGAWQIR